MKLNLMHLNEQLTPTKEELNKFKLIIDDYLKSINNNKSERNKVANSLSNLFSKLGFKVESENSQYGNSAIDLSLNDDDNDIIVMIEAKEPNSLELINLDDLNKKSLYELILYYLRLESNKKLLVKYFVITDFYKFYFLKTTSLRSILEDKHILKVFKNHNKTEEFYKGINEILSKNNSKIDGYFLDLNDLDPLLAYNLFSKKFLFEELNLKDTNILNQKFYDELLYILGLCEENEKIVKSPSDEDNLYNLIQKALSSKKIDYGFDSVIKYIIIWLNRILFLKLIETNLINFNSSNEKLKFLTFKQINDFDSLNFLFFDIFAKNFSSRDKNSPFFHLPYLNSSLFEVKECEKLLTINELKNNSNLSIFKNSVIKNTKNLNFLSYLFKFLDSYDFGVTNKNIKEQKELISSSVLGLVFEKLNGYKEGSFYTPNFITSYMCKSAITKAVINKFNEMLKIDVKNLDELKEVLNQKEISKDKRVEILNLIRICDPSVGSAHFLVSALCEMIKIHYELRTFKNLNFEDSLKIENDEIIIKIDNKIFNYKRCDLNSHMQKIQVEIFNLKKMIIENNLFGVDINKNSVEIARLRLWIELLKNSYFIDDNKDIQNLATLPNIDINIKDGNSLISRFRLKEQMNLKINNNLKNEIKRYKEDVAFYKNVDEKTIKENIEKRIENLKNIFKSTLSAGDIKVSYEKLLNQHIKNYGTEGLDNDMLIDAITKQSFNYQPTLTPISINRDDSFFASIGKLKFAKDEYYNVINAKGYENAMEWRYEFPEVLDDSGEFMGFDLIIGNPPYIRQEAIKNLKPFLKDYEVFNSTSDIYTYFYELGAKLLKKGGLLCFITSNKFTRANYGAKLREFLLNKELILFIDLNGIKVFDSALVDTSIILFKNTPPKKNNTLKFIDANSKDLMEAKKIEFSQEALSKDAFIFANKDELNLKNKIEQIGVPLKEWDISINYGIKTGFNEAFIIDEKTKEQILNSCKDESEFIRTKKIIKKMLRGRDIKRYHYKWEGLYIIGTFPSLKLNIDDYPALKNYLMNFMPRIKQTGEKGCRKKTSNKWFETQDNIAYYKEFEKEKIIYNPVNADYYFVYLNEEFYFNNSLFMITSDSENLKYLVGILNSKFANYLKILFTNLSKVGVYAYGAKDKIEKIPIPKITPSNKNLSKEIINLVDGILEFKKQNKDTSMLEKRIDEIVYKLYGLSEGEIKIVEGLK